MGRKVGSIAVVVAFLLVLAFGGTQIYKANAVAKRRAAVKRMQLAAAKARADEARRRAEKVERESAEREAKNLAAKLAQIEAESKKLADEKSARELREAEQATQELSAGKENSSSDAASLVRGDEEQTRQEQASKQDRFEKCRNCGGKGVINDTGNPADGGVVCGLCHGTGTVNADTL